MKIPELLAPVGDFDCLVAAVQNGADSVYFGSSFFNARASATNFDLNSIEKSIDYAKLRNVKTHLTLNTLIKENEFEQAAEVANQIYAYGIDAIIVQDLGLARFLIKTFPDLPIHASTQMTIHNLAGALKMQELGFKRVVLAREVPIAEIKRICENTKIEVEAFLHGALCISYSGQCLFSSMVGGRSGNRGKCAQACRLPYELLKDSVPIEKGYLLSPKDVSSLPILPELMDAGIDCFKIEGRMKTPEYVATVTRIYRNYIDSVLEGKTYQVSEKDSTQLMQVFNRGGFSTGHLLSKPNNNLIYKEKSNNQGLFLGTVLAYLPSKGHIKLKLETPLAIGDTLSLDSETGTYTISELMLGKQNLSCASAGQTVVIGRMKGNIQVGGKIYKMSSKELSVQASETFSGKEFKKIPLQAKLFVKNATPVSLEITCNVTDSPYTGLVVNTSSDLIPELATSSPITQERLKEQISKTGNTPFCFSNIEIDSDENLYLPSIGKLNELRRQALEALQEKAKATYKRESVAVSYPYFLPHSASNPKVNVLLNQLNETEDYSYLEKVTTVYIPFSYFLSMPEIVHSLCNKYSVFLYLPTIMQSHLETSFENSIQSILSEFSVKGVVISNLSQLHMVPESLERVANFTLNIFNTHTIAELKNLGFTYCTVSPELNKSALETITSSSILPTELLVYGKLPLMTMQYCLLSHHNHCPSHCSAICSKQANYELKDRLGFRFKIVPDSMQTITTLYNSKITSIPFSDIPCDSVRISFLEETEAEKRMVIETILSGNRLEGEKYTNGNFSREV